MNTLSSFLQLSSFNVFFLLDDFVLGLVNRLAVANLFDLEGGLTAVLHGVFEVHFWVMLLQVLAQVDFLSEAPLAQVAP